MGDEVARKLPKTPDAIPYSSIEREILLLQKEGKAEGEPDSEGETTSSGAPTRHPTPPDRSSGAQPAAEGGVAPVPVVGRDRGNSESGGGSGKGGKGGKGGKSAPTDGKGGASVSRSRSLRRVRGLFGSSRSWSRSRSFSLSRLSRGSNAAAT